MCWICTGPHPPNASLLQYLLMSGPPPSLLSPFWTCSPQDCRLLLTTPQNPCFPPPKNWKTGKAVTSTSSSQVQPLTVAHLSTTFGSYHSEINADWVELLIEIISWSCLELKQGAFFVCRYQACICLPSNWTETCTLAYLLPPLSYTTDASIFPTLVTHFLRQ
jgi:hypothetical protein